MLSLKRIFSIAILDATVREKFAHIEKESKAIFSALVGVYYYVFTYLCEEGDSESQEKVLPIVGIPEGLNYHQRKELNPTTSYLQQKIPPDYGSTLLCKPL